MDYKNVDVIGDPKTKGSWTYQECLGIYYDDATPPIINTNVSIGRIESLEAFDFFTNKINLYGNREINYKKLLAKAGHHYVLKHDLDSIADLLIKYYSVIDKDLYMKCYDQYENNNNTKSVSKLKKHLENSKF